MAPGRAGCWRSAWKSRVALSRSGSQGSWKASKYQLRRSWPGCPGLEEAEWMRRFEHHQSLDALGGAAWPAARPARRPSRARRPRPSRRPRRRSGRPPLDQHPGSIVADPERLVGGVVAGQIGRDHPVAGVDEGWDLVPAGVPELREAVQQHHQRARARLNAVKAQPVESTTGGPCPWCFPSSSSHRSCHVLPVTTTSSRQPLPRALPSSIADHFSARNIHVLLPLVIAFRTLVSGLLSLQINFLRRAMHQGCVAGASEGGREAAGWSPTSPSSR